MSKEKLAQEYGFNSTEAFLEKSTSIIYDYGLNYYVTKTPKGWLAWIEHHPDYPLGLFESFEEAQMFLVLAFEEASKYGIPIKYVSELGNL